MIPPAIEDVADNLDGILSLYAGDSRKKGNTCPIK
jgi:hypothetical protein